MYTNFAAFISSDYVKKNYPQAKNLEDDLINYGIKTSQQKNLINALSSALYNDITTKIFEYKNSGSTIPSNYVYLRDNYIAPYLLHATILELIPTHYNKLTTIGIQQRNSEFSAPQNDRVVIANLMNGINATAEFYRDKLIKHLCENDNLYPLYNVSEGSTDSEESQDTNVIGGMFLY